MMKKTIKHCLWAVLLILIFILFAFGASAADYQPGDGHECIFTNEKTYPATCMENGAIVKVCVYCGTETDVGIVEIPATGHSWGAYGHDAICGNCDFLDSACPVEGCDGQMLTIHKKAATCTTDGWIYHSCEVCDGYYTEEIVIEATGHSYGDDSVCDNCGFSTDACVHQWDSGVIDEDVITYTCVLCGEKSIRCNHEITDGMFYDVTYHEGVCSLCSETVRLLHVIDSYTLTCVVCRSTHACDHSKIDYYAIDNDRHKERCAVCKTIIASSANHQYTDFIVDIGGEWQYHYCTLCAFEEYVALCIHTDFELVPNDADTHIPACTLCGYQEGDATSHNFSYKQVVDRDSDTGIITVDYLCADCGYVKTVEENYTCEVHTWNYESLGADQHRQICSDCMTYGVTSSHVWGSSKFVQLPTLEEKGIIVYNCALCSEPATEYIDRLTLDDVVEPLTETTALLLYEKLFIKHGYYLLDSIDYNYRFGTLTMDKADEIFEKMFFYGADQDYGKFQQKLMENLDIGFWYDRYFVYEIVDDIAENGSSSQYYSRFSGLYKELLLLSPGNSTDYVDGYNDAMSSVVSENPVQGLFQGMWASVMLFISTVANGVGIGGITVMSILSVLAILVLVWFVIKILKGG